MNNNPTWTNDAFVYHIYPLGLLDAPFHNNFQLPPENRLEALYPWLDHLQWLGVNTLYLGPVFQSESHGYDTTDYFSIDRRLGSNETMDTFAKEVHRRGMRLILDAVFNHSGRSFWAFQDILNNGSQSSYINWYEGLQFGKNSPLGDPFDYQTWAGHYSLPKFALNNAQVRVHLLEAVKFWMDQWQIDGLRLDAADCIPVEFWQELRVFTTSLRHDFWLMGEIVSGDYRHWANPQHLHAVTNYEAFKGLYSSLNDHNYYEIAHTLNRQFGAGGIYRDLQLYNFVDNHDVNRIASHLQNPAHLYPLYGLLFTMPGVPSLYYGSEWGIPGKRNAHSDRSLRPSLQLSAIQSQNPQPHLPAAIKRLAALRQGNAALREGEYRQEQVTSQQLTFWRCLQNQHTLVAINAADAPVTLTNIPVPASISVHDALAQQTEYSLNGQLLSMTVPPNWLAVLNFELSE